MRALMVAVVVMGVMIVGGTVTLGVLIYLRMNGHPAAAPVAGAVAPVAVVPGAAGEVVLDQPAGTHIAGIAALGDRLAVQLQGGGPDRVLLLDARTGHPTGTVRLAQ